MLGHELLKNVLKWNFLFHIMASITTKWNEIMKNDRNFVLKRNIVYELHKNMRDKIVKKNCHTKSIYDFFLVE